MTSNFFYFKSVSPESLQIAIREMGNYGFNLSHTAQDPNAFSVSGHGIVGTATYNPSVQYLTIRIIERTGLAKLITDDVINQRLLAALGRA
jgi:hypothetical protein